MGCVSCNRHITMGKRDPDHCFWCSPTVSDEERFSTRSRGGTIGGKSPDPLPDILPDDFTIATIEDVLTLKNANLCAARQLPNSPRRCEIIDGIADSLAITIITLFEIRLLELPIPQVKVIDG